MRLVWLAMLLVAALVAMFWPRDRGVGDVERLEWLATAQQLGVVGYRDPVGVVSRDGQRLAFVEGRRLFETPTSGGPRLELVAAQAQIRHVARGAVDGEWIFEDSATPARWWAVRFGTMPWPVFGDRREIADTTSGSRVHISALRQLAISADGQWVAGTAAGTSGVELWRMAADGSSATVVRPASARRSRHASGAARHRLDARQLRAVDQRRRSGDVQGSELSHDRGRNRSVIRYRKTTLDAAGRNAVVSPGRSSRRRHVWDVAARDR